MLAIGWAPEARTRPGTVEANQISNGNGSDGRNVGGTNKSPSSYI
jgi:hypothetical protein